MKHFHKNNKLNKVMTRNKSAGFNFKMYSVFRDKEAIVSTKSESENLCKNSGRKSKKKISIVFLNFVPVNRE